METGSFNINKKIEPPPTIPFDKPNERQKKIYKGIKMLFSLRLEEALKYFDKIKFQDLHYWAMYVLIIYIKTMQTDDKKVKQLCSKLITQVIKYAAQYCHLQPFAVDDLLSAFKDKEKTNAVQMQERAACQIIAFLLSLKATLQVQAGNYIKGGVTFRKCWKFYEECWKLIEDYKGKEPIDEDYKCDVGLGVGTFNFIISLVPPTFMNFVEIIGFKGDRKSGFEILRQCSKRDTASGFFASIFLQAIYQFYLLDYKSSLNVLDQTLQKYSDNMMSLFSGGYSKRFLGNLKESDECFQKVHDASSQLPQLQLSCTYELGTNAIKLSDWETAIPKFEKYLKESNTEGYRCYCAFELGVSYCFVGKPEKAIPHFQSCVKWVRDDYPFDVYAGRKSKEFLQNKSEPVNKFEMVYFEAKERYKVSLFNEAMEILEKMKGMKVNGEQRALYFCLYGQCMRKTGKIDNAKKYLEDALKEKVKVETLVPPHALVELAECALAKGEIKQAENYLSDAKNHKNYDFQNQVLRQIIRLQDEIKGVKF